VILERAIALPRHIEIQVFADRYGNAVHLGERDCSVQRRHQKLVEEAPSAAVSPALRARMGATAVSAVKAIRYEGAGTLEFLLDREGNFYFLEMNTRLQGEHPVTEPITGLDLVELQLRVAAGERLPLAQEDIRFSGHAIEVRLCAEDPGKGFMPQSGTVALWKMPAQLRVEDALRSGSEVPPFYDSMVAKIIAHGATRDEARRKLMSGLDDAVVLGLKTNQRFLRTCLAHPVFAAGGATTAFIGQHLDELLATDAQAQARAAAVAAVLLYETAGHHRQRSRGRHLAHKLPISQRFEMDGAAWSVDVTAGRHRFEATVGERTVVVEMAELGDTHARFVCDGVFERADLHRDGAVLLLHYRGNSLRIDDRTRAAPSRQAEAGGDGKLRASMNGRVVAVLAEVGQQIQAGQPIVTLEAMKMEHIHAAPVAGTLRALHVKVGEQVAAGRIVAEIESTKVR
jgi:geranyl-CoA carboxylase alpha subunit